MLTVSATSYYISRFINDISELRPIKLKYNVTKVRIMCGYNLSPYLNIYNKELRKNQEIQTLFPYREANRLPPA